MTEEIRNVLKCHSRRTEEGRHTEIGAEWQRRERKHWWTGTNRARVKRRGAEKEKGEKNESASMTMTEGGRECEWTGMKSTERHESMWNTKEDRRCHLTHPTPASLPLLHLFLPPSFCHLSLYSLLLCTFLKKTSLCAHYLLFLCRLHCLLL